VFSRGVGEFSRGVIVYHPGKDLLDALAHNPTINVPVNGPAEEDNLVAAVNICSNHN